jgi:hypothetical protein
MELTFRANIMLEIAEQLQNWRPLMNVSAQWN